MQQISGNGLGDAIPVSISAIGWVQYGIVAYEVYSSGHLRIYWTRLNNIIHSAIWQFKRVLSLKPASQSAAKIFFFYPTPALACSNNLTHSPVRHSSSPWGHSCNELYPEYLSAAA